MRHGQDSYLQRRRHHLGDEGERDTEIRSGYCISPTAIMKLITAALLSAVSCYTELAAAATGHVLTLDPSLSSHEQSNSQHQAALSPETARLVIAQRAGLEDYHVEKALSEEEINAINAHGSQASILGKDDGRRVFILAFVEDGVAESMLARISLYYNAITLLTRYCSSGPKSTLIRGVAGSLGTGD
jgi:hypothetical protein